MINDATRKDLIRKYPVLSDVAPQTLDSALANASLVCFEKGTILFESLSPCNAFPFVLSGKIRVFKQSVSGRELSLYTVGTGDTCIVSTGCLLGNAAYQAAGQVKQKAEMVMMDAKAFDTLLGYTPFREFIFSLISQRIVGLMQLVEEVAFHKLDKRLAGLLLDRGKVLKISHQELADELGTVREIISRLVNSFADDGMILPGRGKIEIIDDKGLKRIRDN